METASLWERLQNEEQRMAAFEELTRLYYTRVKGWIRQWVLDEAEAEDLTQETFLQAWKHCHTFRGEAQFSSWLYTIARRLCIRATQRRPFWLPLSWIWESTEVGEPIEYPSGSSVEEIESSLNQAVQGLSPIQRAVWEAVWKERLPYKEVAVRLGIRENTVKSHIYQIRQRLRKALGIE
ncbi:MAG: RNA polymerase sigma factor [Bacteroidia bacterium]|nr:RNA polymerase sigma factor [Bacteroidia bacterium]